MKIGVVIVELSPGMHKAHCPALPGCVVLGRTRQEAAERMSVAVAGYLASFDSVVPEKIELQILDDARRLQEAAERASALAW